MTKTQYLDIISEDVKHTHAIFASHIKEARQARQWTQKTAAQRCLLPLATYRSVENGNITTSIGAYWQVLDTFGLMAGVAHLAAPKCDTVGQLADGSVRYDVLATLSKVSGVSKLVPLIKASIPT